MLQPDLELARELGPVLSQNFGEHYLGSREDRGEITHWVDARVWRQAAEFLKYQTEFQVLEDLMVVDYLDREPRFDLAIVCLSLEHRCCVRLKTLVAEDQPVDSISSVLVGASWYEREMWDLFGVHFNEHPDLRRLLLPADYQGFPLRKDYPVTGPATSAYR